MKSEAIALEVYGCTDVGRVRHHNEDAFVIADLMESVPIHAMPHPIDLEVKTRGVLLAVSDGMGGAQAGEVASAMALHSLRCGLSKDAPSTAEAVLEAGVVDANRDVWDAAATAGRRGMGATLTGVLIKGKRAYVAEVGDSRAYLMRGARLFQVTHDQSCVQALIDSGTLTPEDAQTYQFKNVIMQAIGTKPKVVVALNRFTLREGDRILLCSDGLTGKVKDDEIRDVLASASGLDAACAELVALANSRGGEDNITVVLAKLHGEGLPAFSGEERVSLETVQAFPG